MPFQPGAFTDDDIARLASVKDSLTALAGGGQTGATPITAAISRFTTVATGGDSAQLPPANSVSGQQFDVINAGAQSMNVFPASGEKIGTGSANAAFAVGAGKAATFIAFPTSGTNANWHPILSA